MTTRPLDPVLARQLKRLELPTEVEHSSEWQRFIDGVNEHYLHMAEDRTLLSRSIELSTQEMDGLRRRIETQRDQLVTVITGISQSLEEFARLLQADRGESDLEHATAAKVELARRLQGILDAARLVDERGAEVSGIRDNLLRLADQLISLLTTAGDRAVVRKELEVARAVQQLLIPPQAMIEIPPLRFAGHFQPAEECGGDWWMVSPLPGRRALVVVGDVTGHGVASALITGAAKATCELALHLRSDSLSPSALLAMMNETLYRMARRKIMMTSVAAVIDPAERTLTVANAGHPFPILVRNSITHPILAEGPQLGDARNATFEDSTVELRAGDVMVLFTDGVPECENAKGERFSERRMRSVIQRAAPAGANGVCNALVEALTAFRGEQAPSDDITLVAASVD
jgi:phosphoserine phosphatase RsbU/P